MSPQELYALAMEAANHSLQWCDAWNKFDTLGTVSLGHGANGVVLQHPDCKEAVVKFFDMGDGYLAFATYAKANPAPVFPVVYEAGSNMRGTVGVCVLEKLDRTAWAASWEGSREIPGSPWRDLATSLRGVWRGDKPRAKAAEYQFWPQLLAMAQFFGDSVGYDLHGANWMMRGPQLVLTDPFCGVYGTSTKELASRVLLHRPFRKELTEQTEMDLGPFRPAPDRGARRLASVDFRANEQRIMELMRWQVQGNPQNLRRNVFSVDQRKLRQMDRQVEDEVRGALSMMSVQKRKQWGKFAYDNRPDLAHRGMQDKITACLPPPMPLRLMSKVPDCKVETLTLSRAGWEMLAAQWHIEMQNEERRGWGNRFDRAFNAVIGGM